MRSAFFALARMLLIYGTWTGCDMIYQIGEVHGRYLAEQRIGQNLLDCRADLDAQQMIGQACDRQLFDCEDGARWTAWRP